MLGCVLRVSGAAFKVNEFLWGCTFRPCKVWQVGDQRTAGRAAAVTAGFNVATSDADDLPGQIRDTMTFANRYQQELGRLRTEAGIESLVLDFGISRRDVAAQFDRFPAEIIRLSAEYGMGIELSQYV